ncbi:MAG: PAS domain S-box protein [Acidobacteriaceae bacterium]|nr:PAS domain S-box protein [Acidobacteriaceae bacterium]
MNPAFAQMLGYDKEEFPYSKIADVTYPDDRDVAMDDRLRVFRGEMPRVHFEKRYLTKTGALVWGSVHEVLIRDASGEPLYNLALVEDVTSRKQHEEQLHRKNEELEQFSSTAAHDLQAPLRNIRNSAELLAKFYQGRLDGTADEFLRYILTGTEQMQNLVAALLTYARQEETSAPTNAVSVSRVVEGVLTNLKPEIENTGAEIVFRALPEVRADPVQLSQLFENLIGNALKYRSDKPPRITITVHRREDQWLFSVSDNGIGIPPEQRDRIFAPLKRLHGREIPGTGIGLAICKKIVERQGGCIWVESQPDQGSTFYFTLPVSSIARAAAAE